MTPRRAADARRLRSLCCAGLLCAAMPAQADFPALSALGQTGARISAVAIDLDTGNTLQQLNADTRLTPASPTKLVIAAAALETWPADKMFETRLLGSGKFDKGHIEGDVILQSLGDSTLDHQTLWALASQLKGSGVTSVSGRLLVNTAPFGALGCETKDRCDALKRSDTAYNAPIAAIGVDYGNWCVDVRPTNAGADAVVSGCGVAQLPIPVQGTIGTVGPKGKNTFWVERMTPDGGGDLLRVGGSIPVGAGQSVYRAMSDPALGTGLLVRQVMRESGVQLTGGVQVVHTAMPAGTYPLARIEGLSLKEQLGRMLRFSNNYIADVLTLNLAAAVQTKAPASLADAGGTLGQYVARVQKGKSAKGAPPIYSGSGLTPENELSANELANLLAVQYRNTRNFPAFYGGLVVPRQAPFGFLRSGSPAWLDRVALKTGSMNDPHSVCGVAGYLRKKSGGWMAFSVIVNGGPKQKRVPLYKSMEALRSDIDKILAQY